MNPSSALPFQEVVEAEGHLIDSHIMEQIFDKVVEYSGRFEVEQFRIGRTNSEPSYLRLKVEAPTPRAAWSRCSSQLMGLGCSPVDSGDAALARGGAGPLRARGFLLHHQPPHPGPPPAAWVEAENQRMDALIVVEGGRAVCRRLRDIRAGDQVVVGMRGIRVVPESKERDRLAFAFMTQRHLLRAPGGDRRAPDRRADPADARAGQKVVVVAGPVVVHTGGAAGLWQR